MIEAADVLVQVDWPLQDLWSSTVGFVAITVTSVGLIGLAARSMTIGVLGAYTTFAYFVTTVEGLDFLTNILYVSLALICIALGFKLVRLEAWGE